MIAIVFHYFQPNIRYTIHQPNIKTQPFINSDFCRKKQPALSISPVQAAFYSGLK